MQTIQSIGVLSVAKINAAICGVMGILLMPFFLLLWLAGAGSRSSWPQSPPSVASATNGAGPGC